MPKPISIYFVLGIFVISLLTVQADIQTWNGGTGDWSAAENWTTAVPVGGDEVVITNRGALVLLTNSTPWLSSLIVSNASLSLSNWDTTLYATNLTILSSGILTCAGPFTNDAMSNRVCLICTNLFIATDGAINVNGKGYAGGSGGYGKGNGPGGTVGYYGACYGGEGISGSIKWNGVLQLFATQVYGSATAPLFPGSGGNGPNQVVAGNRGGSGGGAVCITAVQVVVNGTIAANGSAVIGSSHGSGGSGGGIYITCSTITGTNGVITANASDAPKGQQGGGGGGGRIAVIYESAAQSALSPAPDIRFSAASGTSGGSFGYTPGDIGTLYFPDNYFFSPTNLFTGQWLAPGLTNLALSDLVVSNVWLRLPGLKLTVTNTLTIAGTNHELFKLEFTNAATIDCGQIRLSGASLNLGSYPNDYKIAVNAVTSGSTLNCTGDLVLTNSSRFYVLSGSTNSGSAAGYGARVTVGQSILISSNCWILPAAHPTNGTAPLFSMRTLTVNAGGGFNADRLGYSGGRRPGAGSSGLNTNMAYGPGVTNYSAGSGHGGRGTRAGYGGNISGQTYGESNAPVLPGSGAQAGYGTSYPYNGPYGGGSVQIRATDTVLVQGTITANGGDGGSSCGPAASGGAIYISCRTFIGDSNGILQANGGTGLWGYSTANISGGGGGGGRIAVWRIFEQSPTTISNYVNGGPGNGTNAAYANCLTGGVGTIVWGWIVPPNGSIVSVY